MRSLNKIYGFLIVLFFTFSKVYSQTPGYMGKKFAVGYGLYFLPSLNNIVLDNSDKAFNTLHDFFLEYAIGKKYSLGTSVRIYKYVYNNTAVVDMSETAEFYGARQMESYPRDTYTMKGRNYTFYLKSFRSKYLAPWGKYFVFGMTINSYTTKYDPHKMNVLFEKEKYNPASGSNEISEFYISDFGKTTQVFRGADILFGNGKSRIYADKFMVDYGYNLNVFAMARALTWIIDDGTYYPSDVYIEKTSRGREAAVNRFNLYFKIGYLF